MNGSDNPQEITVRINWGPAEALPITYANAFMVQHDLDKDTFYVAMAAVPPPILLEEAKLNPDKRDAILNNGIDVIPVVRAAIPSASIRELIMHLQSNFNNYLNAKKSIAERNANSD